MTRVDTVRRSKLLEVFFHGAALGALALVQPLFALLGENPAFFVARGATRLDLVWFALLVGLGLPALSGLGAALLRSLSSHWGRAAFYGWIGTFVLFAVLPLLKLLPVRTRISYLLALLSGALFCLLYRRFRWSRLFVTGLLPALVVCPLWFLVATPVSSLLRMGRGFATAGATIGNPVPMTLIVFDELPLASLLGEDGKIDGGRFPAFAELASQATWYPNAIAAEYSTDTSIPALLTGRHPTPDQREKAPPYRESLFSLAQDHYQLRVLEGVTRLCPESICTPTSSRLALWSTLLQDLLIVEEHVLLPYDWAEWIAPLPDQWVDFRGFGPRDGGRMIASVFGGYEPGERPPLFFIHFPYPHRPWVRLPSGRFHVKKTQRADSPAGGLWPEDEAAVVPSYQRHLLNVEYSDKLLGEVLHELKRLNLFDPSLLIVTADHGISFRPGRSPRYPTRATFRDIINVPLFVKEPLQSQWQQINIPIENIEILPMIAELTQIQRPVSEKAQPAEADPVVRRRWNARDLMLTSRLLAPYLCLSGRKLPVEVKTDGGYLDAIGRRGDRAVYVGWAADVESGRPARQVHLFAGGKLLATEKVGRKREDVGRARNDARLLYSGYEIVVGQGSVDASEDVRIFASLEDRAWEVTYFPWFPRKFSAAEPFDSRPCTDSTLGHIGYSPLPGDPEPTRVDSVTRLGLLADEEGFIWPAASHLAGSRKDQLAVRPPAAGRLRLILDHPEYFDRVNPESDFIPASIAGRLEGDGVAIPPYVGVIVNGVVRATALTYEAGSEIRVEAFVPESSFRRGKNRLEFFGFFDDTASRLIQIRFENPSGARQAPAGGGREASHQR